MKIRNPGVSAIAIGVAGVLALSGTLALAGKPKKPPVLEFEDVTMYVEQNATDGDTEIVMQGTIADEGFRRLAVHAPDGRRVFVTNSHDPSVMGLREFHFESPEPEGETILAAYPEGTYRFLAQSHDGQRYAAEVELSHELPAPATILSPGEDDEVGTDSLTIEWSAGDGLSSVILELENESADPEQSITVVLPPEATRFEVPASFLAPGAQMQIGIGTVAANGNIVFVETPFTTASQ